MAKISEESYEEMDKMNRLICRFYCNMENLIKAYDKGMDRDQFIAAVSALYISFCGATNKKPNYEILNKLITEEK